MIITVLFMLFVMVFFSGLEVSFEILDRPIRGEVVPAKAFLVRRGYNVAQADWAWAFPRPTCEELTAAWWHDDGDECPVRVRVRSVQAAMAADEEWVLVSEGTHVLSAEVVAESTIKTSAIMMVEDAMEGFAGLL